MNEKNYCGVEDTLFIPLTARVEVSIRFPHYFYDAKSLELKDMQQVKDIKTKSSEYTMLASAARYKTMDKFIADFIANNKDGVVVNLGVGLETMNYRLESIGGTFYQLDFVSVITARQKLLGKAKNEEFLPFDIMNFEWIEKLPQDKPILFVASGVFQYFKPEQVSEFISAVKNKLANVQLLFDATNKKGISFAQRYVKKTGNTDAMMYFYIDDGKEFCNQEGVTLLSENVCFTEARKQLKKLKLYTRIAMRVVDNKKIMQVYHIKIK